MLTFNTAELLQQQLKGISLLLPFSSLVSPVTELRFSSSVRNFITLSALTYKFWRKGFTISSRRTLCTS